MIDDLLAQMRAGSRRALSRLLTLVENDPNAAQQIISQIYHQTGQAHLIGITGSPGSGKSTLVAELAKAFRKLELSVAIVAVDPSSPFSGGALLGDRIRMGALAADKGVFIRSLASRGSLGGLARATSNMVKLLDAAHFELILIETVGAGQAEVEIANSAHTTLVVEAPGMGDGVQSIKAGILEIADILVVNKADKPGALKTVNRLKTVLQLGPVGGTRHHGRILKEVDLSAAETEAIWQTPVLSTIATAGEGIEPLAHKILAHREHLKVSHQWFIREQERTQQEINQLLQERLLQLLISKVSPKQLDEKIMAVVNRKQDIYSAVDEIMNQIIRV